MSVPFSHNFAVTTAVSAPHANHLFRIALVFVDKVLAARFLSEADVV